MLAHTCYKQRTRRPDNKLCIQQRTDLRQKHPSYRLDILTAPFRWNNTFRLKNRKSFNMRPSFIQPCQSGAPAHYCNLWFSFWGLPACTPALPCMHTRLSTLRSQNASLSASCAAALQTHLSWVICCCCVVHQARQEHSTAKRGQPQKGVCCPE